MEIFEILKVSDPSDGHNVNIFLTKDETQTLLHFAFQNLLAIGAVSLVQEKDGVNVAELSKADIGKLN